MGQALLDNPPSNPSFPNHRTLMTPKRTFCPIVAALTRYTTLITQLPAMLSPDDPRKALRPTTGLMAYGD